MKTKVIIMAGGSGTRLWPLSREYFPKQFLKFEELQGESLFQQTMKRALKLVKAEDIIVVTNEKHKFLVMGEAEEMKIPLPEENIIAEPCGKNTLPAIAVAMKNLEQDDTALVLSSDHLIRNEELLISSIDKAKRLSKEALVIFGIHPLTAHTGYGYIHEENTKVLEFVEKPDIERAKEYLRKGYLWNCGIFFLRKSVFDEELKKYEPKVYSLMKNKDPLSHYKDIDEISIDIGLLEKSARVRALSLELNWSDLGSFDALYEEFSKDAQGNHGSLRTDFFGSSNCLVLSHESKKLISLASVDNLIVVDTQDALMICPRNKSQEVKQIVAKLKKNKSPQKDFHLTVYRPWGSYTILEEQETHKVKRLTVNPGKILSLQSHKHRSEHWTVVNGEAYIVNGEQELSLKTNESTYIPAGNKHRLGNKTNKVLEIIEVQSGSYLGEDDIVRYEDKYGRK